MSFLDYLPKRIRNSQYHVDAFVELADYFLGPHTQAEKERFLADKRSSIIRDCHNGVVSDRDAGVKGTLVIFYFQHWEDNKDKLPNTWVDHGEILADPNYVFMPALTREFMRAQCANQQNPR